MHSIQPCLQAAINGDRHAALPQPVPVSTMAIVRAALDCVRAGAESIHFHVRAENGRETLAPDHVAAQLNAIKTVLPNIPVGISTGAWIEPDFNKRIDAVRQWTYLPDFVSVNGHEDNFEHVILALRRKGIRIEAGVRDAAAAKAFIDKEVLSYCFRILIEPAAQELPAAQSTVEEIENLLLGEISNQTVLLHGKDKTAWPMLALAAARGYESRMGFEDSLFLPSGEPAPDNESLIAVAVRDYFPGISATQKKA